MKVTVKPKYARGTPIPADQQARLPGFSGSFEIIGGDRSPYHSFTPVARVQDPPITRFLYEVSVLWFAGDALGLRGVEVIDGVQYAQTWDIKIDLRSLTSGEPRHHNRSMSRDGRPRLDAETLLSFVPERVPHLRAVLVSPIK